MKISIIVAAAENGAIGKNNQLLWRLSDDLINFKQLTSGHHILMGRHTYESLGKPLPYRTNMVLSKNKIEAKEVRVFSAVDDALHYAETHSETELFVIGGGKVYAQLMPRADKVYLTLVHAKPDADTFFDVHLENAWVPIRTKFYHKNEKNEYDFTFSEWIRKQSANYL